ncbi:MAG: methyltransferase domain-containing protein, partial [Roseiflexaceae bacterium]|nr:methyltransferase domain-containing protein [Roseiflexaceae bacterium]
RVRYRVVARMANQASYRRIDLQEAVEKGIRARKDRNWEFAEEHALEFWVTALPTEILLGLRLTDAKMRRHDEKRVQLPAALRPAAAAALVWLSRPRPTDVFLDPMCGSGTLLIERGEAGRYKQLLGGDISEQAVDAAQVNIGIRYQPITIQQWDATSLPIEAATVTNVAVNLPFGQQIGSPEENRSLYPSFMRELARVVRPAGRIVTLTGDTRNFERTLERNAAFQVLQRFDVMVLGRTARVYAIERK